MSSALLDSDHRIIICTYIYGSDNSFSSHVCVYILFNTLSIYENGALLLFLLLLFLLLLLLFLLLLLLLSIVLRIVTDKQGYISDS